MKLAIIQASKRRFDLVLTDNEGSQIGEGAIERGSGDPCNWWIQKWDPKAKKDVVKEGQSPDIAHAEVAAAKAVGVKTGYRFVRVRGKLLPATLPTTTKKTAKAVCPKCGR